MATLTKAELSESLAQKADLNRRDSKEFVENLFELIRVKLENRVDMKVSGFGNFETREKAERPGRNPKTGEDIPISARVVVTFKPSNKLKDRIENIAVSEEDQQKEQESV